MVSASVNEQLSKIAAFNGIEVFWIKSRKFKTNSINIFFCDNLCRENAAKNALVPALLRRGCASHPTFGDIALYLEELYGASFDCGVSKKGEYHIVQFYIDHINDKFAGDNISLFEKCMDLLLEIINEPVAEDGAFKKDYVEQEKENLRRLIESRVNDKAQYAVERCYEVMCGDEPFGVYEYGAAEDISAISPEDLFKHYGYMLESLPMLVFIAGDIEDDKVNSAIKKLSAIERKSIKKLDAAICKKEVESIRNEVEHMSVNQGKLCLGFRTNTDPGDKDYCSLLVYNTILGGGVHSKLFQNIREKESMAYYAYSRLEKFKGLMVVSSGIESSNKDKVIDIVLKQMEDMKAGRISDYEYDSSINTIETGVKSLADSQLSIVDFFLGQTLIKAEDDFESLIQKVKAVTREDIVRAAERIKLDTIYFLTA
ncbi:MAG: insulinase family protein [Clostridia bacterium]|nr:insulinase family protein [Clostridia bacterium]